MERAEVQAMIREEIERSSLATRARQLQGALGGMTIRAGQGTLTWGGVFVNSAPVTFNHNLGKTPVAVVATGIDPSTQAFFCYVLSVTATQITLRGVAAAVPAAGSTGSFTWVASG